MPVVSPQSDAGWEEYYDYLFPDDEANRPNFKLLQMARMWKQTKDSNSSESEDDEERRSDEDKPIAEDEEKGGLNQDEDTDLSSEDSDDE